ncbi:NCT transcriptional regulatory complex subunit B [Fulvia fulva]|uniref:NCT transcriptional regulatory complex subunit B n=1 Tax=Passalora fulva TaxID=5499 RepID=A0A9Q8PDE4_PASFU|nr:NCT transcriptional regulatory complex subunit B [Fulvia fulva]KAK4619907.1 NCT transcriptional regulatory complex subunit B [Fulvia fulva]KAK4620425.1 NCT transcriptional regulatory complex subunit B [Fulvia fulva]UJO20413.1 NCT transcriptional regulatory complex subunit B [Fulvia fulva]WPV17321.1 NCT transcriptional regulatory complex subunit B [Fulvia fulva]WPV31816.1 NCT transcriptional regulatory complex subunit B [Fulvia fulva]
MSDKEFGGNDDLSLPKATVQKIINEVLATNPAFEGANLAFAKDTRDILIECCVEFITMLTSEANEIAEKDAKKTIACEHITKAIADLGYPDFVPELEKVAAEFKTQQAHRERKQTKIEQSGMSHEELLKAQEELFKSAGDKYNAGPAE